MKRREMEEKEGKKREGPHRSSVRASPKGPSHGESQRTSTRNKAHRGRNTS